MHFCSLFIILVNVGLIYGNYYETLGLSKSATDLDIKKAYKKLAKIWHPDKNKNSDAEATFMKINEAYEILSNPDKRKEYDTLGSVSNEPRQQYHGNFEFFADHFGQSFFGFHESFNNDFESINYRTLKMNIIPDSKQEPILMLIVSQMCFYCHRALRLWKNLAEQLKGTGVRMTICDIMRDGRLQEELRVHAVPKIVLYINGEIRYYQDDMNSENIVAFVRNAFARDLVTPIYSVPQLNAFHDGWMKDSRSRMLLLKPLSKPSMRFMTMAFKYRDKIVAGFVNVEDQNGNNDIRIINDMYSVEANMETLLLFHSKKIYNHKGVMMPESIDNLRNPKLSLSDMEAMLNARHRLPFPRITSQVIFDRDCPPPSSDNLKPSLCMIALFHSGRSRNLSDVSEWMRLHSLSMQYETVKSLYMFSDIQHAFIDSLNCEAKSDDVILLWRLSYSTVRAGLLKEPWSESNNLEHTFQQWSSLVQSKGKLTNEMLPVSSVIKSRKLPTLVDELSDPLWRRVFNRLSQYIGIGYGYLWLLLDEPWTVTLVVLIFVTTYYLYANLLARIRETISVEKEIYSNESNEKESMKKQENMQRIKKITVTNQLYQHLISSNISGKMYGILLTTNNTSYTLQCIYFHCIDRLNTRSIEPLILRVDKHPKWLASLLSCTSPHVDVLEAVDKVTRNSVHSYEGILLVANFSRRYFFVCNFNLLCLSTNSDSNITDSATASMMDDYQDDNETESASSNKNSQEQQYKFNCINSNNNTSAADGTIIRKTKNQQILIEQKIHDWLCQLLDGSCKKFRIERWPQNLSFFN